MTSSGSAVAGTTQMVASACTGGMDGPLPSNTSSVSDRPLASSTPAANVLSKGAPASPPPHRRVPTVDDAGHQGVLEVVAGGVAARGGQRRPGPRRRGRTWPGRPARARPGRPVPWRRSTGGVPRAGEEPGQRGRHGGLARALAGADDRDRRLGGHVRPRRGVEAEVGALVGGAGDQGAGGQAPCAGGGRGRARRRGRRRDRARNRRRPSARAAWQPSPRTTGRPSAEVLGRSDARASRRRPGARRRRRRPRGIGREACSMAARTTGG